MLDGKLRREFLRKGLYQRRGLVDHIQEDASGAGTAQTDPVLLAVDNKNSLRSNSCLGEGLRLNAAVL